jgi:hypothetical protein
MARILSLISPDTVAFSAQIVIAGLQQAKHHEWCYTPRQLRRDAPQAIPISIPRFDDSDVDSFDVRHRFLNTAFSITFYFNELAATLKRLVWHTRCPYLGWKRSLAQG